MAEREESRGASAEAGAGADLEPGPSAPDDVDAAQEPVWDLSDSGHRLVSRPIVIDGLRRPVARIELSPRIVLLDGRLVDDSFNAVDAAAAQLVQVFTLEQLVMATVALRVHMRKGKEFIERRRALQERWSGLARRLMKLRVEDERLRLREEEHREKMTAAERRGSLPGEVATLLELDGTELTEARRVFREESQKAWKAWSELEEEDAVLLRGAPHLEKTRDLKFPYVLTLFAPRPDGSGRSGRSLPRAMHDLVETLQRPLSRTDQMLLEIALRRCIRESAPLEVRDVEGWEKCLLQEAEAAYLAEFPWAVSHLGNRA